jgi:hypothetical protein
VSHPSTGGAGSGVAVDDYLLLQYERLKVAADLCYRVKLSWPFPDKIDSFDNFRTEFLAESRRQTLWINAEKRYVHLLHDAFAVTFAFFAERVAAALPQYREGLTFLASIRAVHGYPDYEASDASLKDLSRDMVDLRGRISGAHQDTIAHMWTTQYDGCRTAVGRCESLFKQIQEAVKYAAAEHRSRDQDKLAQETKEISEKANSISEQANSLSNRANTIAGGANDLSKQANELAASAEKTARVAAWAAGIATLVAVLALGWDARKWWIDSHKADSSKQTAIDEHPEARGIVSKPTEAQPAEATKIR